MLIPQITIYRFHKCFISFVLISINHYRLSKFTTWPHLLGPLL